MVLKGRPRLPKELVMIPLSTESIEWPPTGPPSEAYSLGAQPTSLKTKTSSLCPSLLKSATNQPTGTQGKPKSIHGIGSPPVSWHSGAVSVLGDQHVVLRALSTTILLGNASSYTTNGLDLENAHVHFLPHNCASKIQPMDTRIIVAFKLQYRRLHLQNPVDPDERGDVNMYKVDQLTA